MSPADLDRQPILEGEALRLRPLGLEDFDALFAVAADPLIWEQHPAHDRWQEPVFRVFFADALAHGGALAVIDKRSGAVIGSSRYQGLEPEVGGSIEIGWTFLAREYWGGKANLELKRLMVRHALASVAECRFAVGEENWRSRKAMEKIGGRLSDRVEDRKMAGTSARHVHYVIGRSEFAGGPLGATAQ
ncbi:GNAT family N-acetyltransferase [Erythrobacter litoralis]|uniref:Acetyltransferase, putative n=1 Tax=Erythrobacter litoralis (strain HTCC2594) TaxID=314225 RepID=Q2NDX2_ERYLH|nr:GNAT family N-acetyltransferase [Erythrobacter litoralis]ABC62119.1 acetyltransferase, putative [Erythrobacter litoralis HTCC2594]